MDCSRCFLREEELTATEKRVYLGKGKTGDMIIVLTGLLLSGLPVRAEEVLEGVGSPAENISLPLLLLKLGVALAVLVGLLILTARLSRGRLPRLGSGAPVDIILTHPVGPRKNIQLLQIGSRALLLGVSEQEIRTLAEFTPEEIAVLKDQVTPRENSFADILDRFTRRKKNQ
jgi:flagellar biogenesis protein FliO